MKKLLRMNGACAPCALHYVSSLDEGTVLRVCHFHNFAEGEGMEDADWKKAATELRIEMRGVSMEPTILKKFIKKYGEGLYLVGTWDHLFVVDNGVIVDPRCAKPPGLYRIVKQAWRVYK